MEKIHQKEMLQIKQQQQKAKQSYRHALDNLLNNQTLRILIQYCKQQLKTIDISQIQNINDYSPVSISRLIFAKQLSKIKDQLKKLPNYLCPLDHFLIIMLKVVKFPFQKTPYYLLGLKQMFKQIKQDQKSQRVSYQQIQNYVMGQVVNFTDQTQHDTQFQIQFTQNKMQDFLMHDNGVKKIIYSHDLKKFLVLDQSSSIIKIYDQNMKMISRFEPNKDKHNKKRTTILTFDYNEFGSKLVISLSDSTLSIVHLGNFLSASSQQAFRSVFLNQVVYKASAQITKICFLSMMNKWLCIDISNQIWIYDIQNFKQENQNYCKKFKHPNDDYQIKDVCEYVNLSAIAFVINNDVWFFNQTLSKKKFKKFSHCEEIKKFLYCQQKNQFYLVGKDQKYITIFTINKVSGDPNKIWTFATNQIISDFDVFPYHNSILVLDSKNNLKVYSIDQPLLQYQQNYDLIVKKKQLPIKFVKTTKTSFLIHATYILVMQLKKVAIERDIDFTFQQTFFYDHNKQEIVFSVNGQIMGLSLMHGEIRKSIAPQNSNLDKHKAFHMAKNTQPFVIDPKDSLYQVLYKTDNRYKQYKDYRKNVGISDIKKSFYDQQYRMVIMISENSIYMVRNDSQNNFTFKSCLLLQNSPHFIKYKYNNKSKQIIFLDSNNIIYIMNSYNFKIQKIMKINIFKQWNEGQKMVLDLQYDQQLEILMILTNNGQFAVFNINNNKSIYVKIKDFLPYKLQTTTFTSFNYQKTQKNIKLYNSNKHISSRIFFYNQTGFLIQFQFDQMINKVVNKQTIIQKLIKISYIKQTHQVDLGKLLQSFPPQLIKLQKSSLFKLQPRHSTFIKVHDKPIVFSKRIILQDYLLLTIGQDGHLKLWGQNRKIYFDLKLPLMLKIEWNMNQIHEKRNLRIISQTKTFLEQMANMIKKNKQKHILNMDIKKKLRNKSQKIKINLDNPINIQFQNKDLQQIVMNKKDFNIQNKTIDVLQRQRRFQNKRMNLTQRISEPWRKKSQFKQIFDKASPVDKYLQKYKQKMPFQVLLMRNDLHMDQTISPVKFHKNKNQQLTILPQLKSYYQSKQIENKQSKATVKPSQIHQQQVVKHFNPQEQNKFETCLFVKTQRGPKKGNAFDQIDKFFWKKQHQLMSKKWIPNKRNLMKNHNTLQPKSDNSLPSHSMRSSQLSKIDPVKQIIKIFEQHNKQALHERKGRLIKIPKMENKSKEIILKKN